MYKWNLRCEKRLNIKSDTSTTLNTTVYKSLRQPHGTLDTLGVLQPTNYSTIIQHLHTSNEQILQLVTDSQLNSSQHISSLDQIIKQFECAASYRTIKVGLTCKTWMQMHNISHNVYVDEWPIDERALLVYLSDHPRYKQLFIRKEWDAIAAIWCDIIIKLQKSSTSCEYTHKPQSTIMLEYCHNENSRQMDQHLSNPITMPKNTHRNLAYNRLNIGR